jgi:hypothetical protein
VVAYQDQPHGDKECDKGLLVRFAPIEGRWGCSMDRIFTGEEYARLLTMQASVPFVMDAVFRDLLGLVDESEIPAYVRARANWWEESADGWQGA